MSSAAKSLLLVRENCDRRFWDMVNVNRLNEQTFLLQFLRIKADKCRMLDHRHQFRRFAWRCHAAQTATQRLLRQDVCLRRVRPQRNNGRHVSHIPAFAQHQHRHDARVRILVGINLPRQFTQRLQILVADFALTFLKNRITVLPAANPFHFAFEIRVQVRRLSIQFLECRVGVQPVGNLIRVRCVLGHHKEQRLFPALLPFLFRLQPARITDAQLLLKSF